MKKIIPMAIILIAFLGFTGCATSNLNPKLCECTVTFLPEDPPAETPITTMVEEPLPIPVNRVVYFKFDSFDLDENAKEILDMAIMDSVEEYSIDIEGHADKVGTEKYNMELSIKRAASVKAYFMEAGVPEETIFIAGKGESELISEKNSENRRAVITIFTK